MRLAMSDELATDEETAAGEYEVHTLGGDDELDEDAVEVGPENLNDLTHIHKSVQKEEERSSAPPAPHANRDDLVFDAEEHRHIPPSRPSYDAGSNEFERERLQLSDDDEGDTDKAK